jgi:hypothetical protein
MHNYKRTTYEYETERITLKHQQNMCIRSLRVEIEMMSIQQDYGGAIYYLSFVIYI